jgi:methylenetetrahydrofolate reductase (NADPH)
MHIGQILKEKSPSLSFEFFPPKSDAGSSTLFDNIKDLMPLKPAYVSVTYGAGGSTRSRTHDLVVKLQKETNLTIIAHLTCVGSSKDEIGDILEKYQANGIKNIMALRGDAPQNNDQNSHPEEAFKHAAELVAFIKKNFPEMGVGVAGFPEGHPSTPNRLKEMDYLRQKIDAGADYICTQLFFNNQDFYDFSERCSLYDINVPIVAGLMPITSKKGMIRMAELALGARIPAGLMKAVMRAEDDAAVEQIGIQWATEQVRDLLDNQVKGIHFYTLNKSKATLDIYNGLGIKNSDALGEENKAPIFNF